MWLNIDGKRIYHSLCAELLVWTEVLRPSLNSNLALPLLILELSPAHEGESSFGKSFQEVNAESVFPLWHLWSTAGSWEDFVAPARRPKSNLFRFVMMTERSFCRRKVFKTSVCRESVAGSRVSIYRYIECIEPCPPERTMPRREWDVWWCSDERKRKKERKERKSAWKKEVRRTVSIFVYLDQIGKVHSLRGRSDWMTDLQESTT